MAALYDSSLKTTTVWQSLAKSYKKLSTYLSMISVGFEFWPLLLQSFLKDQVFDLYQYYIFRISILTISLAYSTEV